MFKNSLYVFLLLAFGLLFTSCGGGSIEKQETAVEVTECNLTFPKVHQDQKHVGDTTLLVKSVYVENFLENELCWAAMKEEASRQAQVSGISSAKVYFFDCPGHHPALSVDSSEFGVDYQVHCVASFEHKLDGTEDFKPKPFASSNSGAPH